MEATLYETVASAHANFCRDMMHELASSSEVIEVIGDDDIQEIERTLFPPFLFLPLSLNLLL